jgi:hypothetical protein
VHIRGLRRDLELDFGEVGSDQPTLIIGDTPVATGSPTRRALKRNVRCLLFDR